MSRTSAYVAIAQVPSPRSPKLVILAIVCFFIVAWLILTPSPSFTSLYSTPPSREQRLLEELKEEESTLKEKIEAEVEKAFEKDFEEARERNEETIPEEKEARLIVSTTSSTIRAKEENDEEDDGSLGESSVFVYRAYVDERFNDGLRVLYMSRCEDADKVAVYVNGTRYEGETATIEYGCPWRWAPNCSINSHILHVPTAAISPNDVIELRYRNRSVSTIVVAVPTKKQDTLEVCVPPLYWHANWPQLIAFIELWKLQNASHFYIYHYSVSKTVLSILQHYEKTGLVTLVPWPALPRTDDYDPNLNVYRLAHSIAHNDCLRRTRGFFTALVDFDEFILARPSSSYSGKSSPTLLQFAKLKLKRVPDAAAFSFNHTRLSFVPIRVSNDTDPPEIDFDGIERSFVVPREGPPKIVFLPERVHVMMTHKVHYHRNNYKSYWINTTEAMLFHARDSWTYEEPEDQEPVVEFFSTAHAEGYERNARKVLRAVFNETPFYDQTFPQRLGDCLIQTKISGCKTIFADCFDDFKEEDDWVFADNPEDGFKVL